MAYRNDLVKMLMQTLGLDALYPSKISLQQVMRIEEQTGKSVSIQADNVPLVMLKKLIMTDHRARENVLMHWAELNECEDGGESDSSDIEAILEDASKATDLSKVHPLDAFVAIFGCCDLLLKQTLLQKMFMCRLAVPLIYPNMQKESSILSVWSMRTIIAEWRNEKEAVETNVVVSPVKTVSFVKCGKPEIPKSKHLNHVIESPSHASFFNSDCTLGDADRLVAPGLVEASWYFPSGKETDVFRDCLMFLNLRGDAEHYDEIMKTICKISKVMVVFIDLLHLQDEKFRKLMTDVYSNELRVLIVFKTQEDKQDQAKTLQEYKDGIGISDWKKTTWIKATKGKIDVNPSELKKKIQKTIKKLIQEVDNPVSILELSKYCSSHTTIKVDEKDEECLRGKQMADDVMKVSEGQSFKSVLQLQDCWLEWSQLQKKIARNNQTGTRQMYEADVIAQTMKKLREKQVEMSKNISPTMENFIKVLNEAENNVNCVVFFLQWLKIYLDHKSRELLPELHKKYHDTRSNLSRAVKSKNGDMVKQYEKELKKAEECLVYSTFGVEHLFREAGQMYEAFRECDSMAVGNKSFITNLPRMVAELIRNGCSFELMDGDNASVPIVWIKAVFQSLEKLLGKKKVFVISVLGIQSSGKSTMLNAMFGLQFSVSAGRCTRGVYLQLVEVDKQSSLPYDFVCVVDTEGLRAPELGNEKNEHDNELATLVIGLGDVTIMNIKGENVSEMQDVLQITVHAFMRMKLINKNITLGKKCVFLHQNVPAVNAREKTKFGTEKMNTTLDLMAREAAAQEGIKDINSFKNIIDFDEDKHVLHFPDLWMGNPPMATVNPRYSEKIANVKEMILFELAREQSSVNSMSDIAERLNDLWDAILHEDFVFSFKNSLAVKAYTDMESTYTRLAWDMESHTSKWVSEKALIAIQRANTANIDKCHIEQIRHLRHEVSEKSDIVQEKLKKYFDECSYKDITTQWKERKLNSLKVLAGDLTHRFSKEIKAMKKTHEIDLTEKQKYITHESQIMQKAKDLADYMKEKRQTPSDDELHSAFKLMWNVWISDFGTDDDNDHSEIVDEVDTCLWNSFEAHHAFLKKELQTNPLNSQTGRKYIKQSGITSSHFSKLHFLDKFKNIFTSSPDDKCRQHANRIAISVMDNVEIYLNDIKSQGTPFRNIYATNVVHLVQKGVSEHNIKEEMYSLTPNFLVLLAVHACQYAVPVFQEMRADYDRKHSVAAKLATYKQKVWNLFNNTVNARSQERIASELLIDQVDQVMLTTVQRAMKNKVVDEIVQYFSCTKATLIVAILDNLARKESFGEYQLYLDSPKNFALKWITEFTNENLFNAEKPKIKRYKELAETHVNQLTKCLLDATEHATEAVEENNPNMYTWVQEFLGKTEMHIALTDSDLNEFFNHSIANSSNLKRLLLDRFKGLAKRQIERMHTVNKHTVFWGVNTPYKLAADKLWGCDEVCPFCNEPCQKADPNHYKSDDCHQCIQHKPRGLIGTYWKSGESDLVDTLVIEYCNFSVHQRIVSFGCNKRNCKDYELHKAVSSEEIAWHNYGEYKNHVPEWDIHPNSKPNGSKYWMFFMNKYKTELAKWHCKKTPRIPETWKNITFQEACDSLRIYTP